jgi:hypothetical protein
MALSTVDRLSACVTVSAEVAVVSVDGSRGSCRRQSIWTQLCLANGFVDTGSAAGLCVGVSGGVGGAVSRRQSRELQSLERFGHSFALPMAVWTVDRMPPRVTVSAKDPYVEICFGLKRGQARKKPT